MDLVSDDKDVKEGHTSEGEEAATPGDKEEEGTVAIDRPSCLPVLHQAPKLDDDHLGRALLPLYR